MDGPDLRAAGAATVVRADVLRAHPFSSRTGTEDADHTLSLAAASLRVGYLREAPVWTEVPRGIGALLRQRRRWTAGHLQCALLHLAALPRPGRARLTLLNFAFVSIAAAVMLGCGLYVGWRAGTPLLGIAPGWWVAAALALAYLQRVVVMCGLRLRAAGPWSFVLEPPGMALVYAIALVSACAGLALRRRRNQ